MNEPLTRAGQALDLLWPGTSIDRLEWRNRILAIEWEAAAAARTPSQPDSWQEEARRYAENADYWRKRAEECEGHPSQPDRDRLAALSFISEGHKEAYRQGWDAALASTLSQPDLREALRVRITGAQLVDGGVELPDGYFLDVDEHDDFIPVSAHASQPAPAAPSYPLGLNTDAGDPLDAPETELRLLHGDR